MYSNLGCALRDFASGLLDEDLVDNIDEVHFLNILEKGKAFKLCGALEEKFSDVTSVRKGMNLLVKLVGGRNAEVLPDFVIFQNASRRYPMRRLFDDVPSECYRTQP